MYTSPSRAQDPPVCIAVRPPWAWIYHGLTRTALDLADIALTTVSPKQEIRKYLYRDRACWASGLTYRVLWMFHARSIQVHIDWPTLPDLRPDRRPFADGRALREEQLRALDACETHHRGLVAAGTGWGKTFLLAGIARDFPTARVLVLVHRTDLVTQTGLRDLAALLGEPIGQIGRSVWDPQRVTVTTIQTLVTRAYDRRTNALVSGPATELMAGTQILLADEAHTTITQRMGRLLLCCPAPIRIALTGTPARDDDPDQPMRLESATGPLIYQRSTAELADMGLASRVTVYLVDWSSWRIRGVPDEWPECYEEGIVGCAARNGWVAILAARSIEAGRPTMVFAQRQDHGPVIQQLVHQLGHELPCLDGNSPHEARQEIWRSIRDGGPGVITSMIAREGLDLPAVRTIILASGRKSNIELLQVLGRGARLKPDGPNELDLVDLIDMHADVLRRHTRRRASIWGREGHRVIHGYPPWLLRLPSDQTVG